MHRLNFLHALHGGRWIFAMSWWRADFFLGENLGNGADCFAAHKKAVNSPYQSGRFPDDLLIHPHPFCNRENACTGDWPFRLQSVSAAPKWHSLKWSGFLPGQDWTWWLWAIRPCYSINTSLYADCYQTANAKKNGIRRLVAFPIISGQDSLGPIEIFGCIC